MLITAKYCDIREHTTQETHKLRHLRVLFIRVVLLDCLELMNNKTFNVPPVDATLDCRKQGANLVWIQVGHSL